MSEPITNALIQALSPWELDALYVQFCRASVRRDFWKSSGNHHVAGPIGRLFDGLINERRKLLPKREFQSNSEVIRQALSIVLSRKSKPVESGVPDKSTKLDESGEPKAEEVTEVRIREFLDGKSGRRCVCFLKARELLAVLLRGTASLVNQTEIEQFFFPDELQNLKLQDVQPYKLPRADRWYFNPSFREHAPGSPQTTAEIVAEHRRLELLHKGSTERGRCKCVIVRISEWRRFLVVDGYRLTTAGEAAVRAMEAGIQQVFVYPEGDDSPAHSSFEEFRKKLRPEFADAPNFLRVVRVPKGGHEAATSPFGCGSRAVIFLATPEPVDPTKQLLIPAVTVAVTHRSDDAYSSFDVDDDMRKGALEWLRTIGAIQRDGQEAKKKQNHRRQK